jgi:hypothetical protein
MFQHLCSSTCACSITNRLPSMTTLTICVSFCVPALFQHCVSAFVFQHLCSSTCACSITNRLPSMTTLTICVSFCVPALFQHCVSTSVYQHLCFSVCVSASVFQHLLCVLHKQSIAINDNLNHLLQSSVISISPTISPFGIDGNMSFISPPLTSRAKG